jgi:hypothetical protein
MTIEYIRYGLTRHTPADLIEAYTRAGAHLEAAPECLGFDLAQCSEDPNVLILRIEWISASAHLSGFRKGQNFPPFLAAIRPFISEIAEMRHYEVTPVSWHRNAR